MQSRCNKGLRNFEKSYNVDLSSFSSRLPSLSYIYGLPKEDIPPRSIISNVNSPSYNLSKWLAKKLSPLLGKFSVSHLQHNKDLFNSLHGMDPNG